MAIEKSKFQATFFSFAAMKNMFFKKTVLLYLKVISNIVNASIYWERHNEMSPN